MLEGVADIAKNLKVGPGLDPETEMGPLVSKKQQKRVMSYINSALAQGATIVAGGEAIEGPGSYVQPTVISDVDDSMTVCQEEIFGPVLAIQTFRKYDEALTKANNTPYGLSGGIWTDKGSKIFNMTQKIRAGVVWANTFNKFDPTSPFGGYKESGVGREGGLHGLDAYVKLGVK